MGKLLQLLTHPDEFKAVVQLLGFRKSVYKRNLEKSPESLNRCYELLYLTSRSFAVVIDELHPELKDVVMIFYLLLRALDTVEDDMSIDPKIKVPWLKSFADLLSLKEYSYHEVDEKEKDRAVLVEFTTVLTEYHKLKPEYQDVLKETSQIMGDGMAKYILDESFNVEGVDSVKDYDLYCHYVAGVVGEGLTKLFILAEFGDSTLVDNKYLRANSMGLFLQKTNIIRDYNEDLNDGRSFWPKEVWSQYTKELPNFAIDTSENRKLGVQCINHLVLNALDHVEDVLVYLSLVKEPSSFNFCAIPQVMAIATLELVYNNPKVLYGHLKLRRGNTCKLILQSRTYPQVVSIFRSYLRKIHHKSDIEDPNYFEIGLKIAKLEQICDMLYPDESSIPASAQTKNDYRSLVTNRLNIDDEVQKVISIESLKCNLAFGTVLFLIGSLIYLIL